MVWTTYAINHISKEKMLQTSSHHMTATWRESPEETQNENKECLPSSCQPPQSCQTLHSGNSGRGNTGYWPQIAEVHLKGMTAISPDFASSLVAQTVKHLPEMWETQVRLLGREDPLEKEMATHSSSLVWKIPWTEEPGRLWSMGSQRVRHDWETSLQYCLHSDLPYGLQLPTWHLSMCV